MRKHYLFIVNPNAAKGKAGKDWLRIERFIRKKDIHYKAVLTSGPGDAISIVEEELSLGYKCLIVVGGDGTVNEVVNGVFHQEIVPPEEISLGIIPVGTGNDWARYYGIPKKYKKALEYLFSGEAHFQDVGKLTHSIDGKPAIHYFVNIAGFGFDAVVVKATNEMQERGNRMAIAYLFNLLRTALSYKSLPMKVEINDEVIERKLFSISIGNGRYSGGGMRQTPNAEINDGMFDVTIYDDMPVRKILKHVFKLYNGKIGQVNSIHTFKTTRITVQDGPDLLAEVDGEIIPDGPFEIEILPSALKVLV
ncbi:MAG: diacylglycerol kinase family lipid kinase [Bacteroidales bacterium]|jgi:YegS/Rv2252/BmrU family lipid kinase|nr:diacylglycerol kinase family lipid kinase [Bacteroidales bacterium]